MVVGAAVMAGGNNHLREQYSFQDENSHLEVHGDNYAGVKEEMKDHSFDAGVGWETVAGCNMSEEEVQMEQHLEQKVPQMDFLR